MNVRALKDKIRNMANETNVDAQALMQNYFLERLLARIAQSDYKELVILKGGLLIASLIGSANRSTMDLDATIKNYPVEKEQIEKMVNGVIKIDVKDDVVFEFISIDKIREEDEYNGYRIKVDAKLDKIVQHLKIDFSTGDEITPKDIEYTYMSMFGDEAISVRAYNLETIIAEKYETVIQRGSANTRMRDFYDLYALMSLKSDRVDFNVLKTAVQNTTRKRNTSDLLPLAEEIIESIEESEEVMKLWTAYCNNYAYASHLNYTEVIEAIKWWHNHIAL